MGLVIHHAIIVTTYTQKYAKRARVKAKRLGCAVTSIVESAINSEYTFLIGPDGSNHGWAHSDEGDTQRDAFIEWARAQREEDGSSHLAWVEVEYSADERAARITRHEWLDGQDDESASDPEETTDG